MKNFEGILETASRIVHELTGFCMLQILTGSYF